MPGGLVLLAAFWMVAAWLVAMGPTTPVHPSAATYEPGVRMMLVCIGIGVFIGWPLLRLSQQGPTHPARQALLDLAVLVAMLQLVIWLPRVLTVWSISRTGAIATFLVGWAVLTGAIVATATATERRGVRNFAMLACIAMCLGGPVVAWLVDFDPTGASAFVHAGPLMGVQLLSEGGSTRATEAQWNGIFIVAGAAVVAWIFVGVGRLLTSR